VDHTSTEILRYKYDADSRLTNRYSIAKGDTYYAYDKVGNLTNTTYPVSPSISLAYDALNHLTNMIDAVGTSKYGYNAAGQLLSEDGPWSDDMVSYSYANRLRSGMSLLQPNAAVWSQTYGYDSARRLTNTTSPAGAFGYAYDGTAEMLVKKLTEPSGAYITNSFDGNARLLSTVLKNSSHSTINSHSYQLNQGNQRTNQTFTDGNYVRYDYDPIGQLTSAVGKEVGGTTNRLQEQLAYGYDAAHNLSARTNNGLVQTFGVNSLNELTNITRTGTFTVAGTSTSSATGVTVNGNSATLYSDKTFAKASVSLGDGNNTFTAIASDALGRSDTNAVTAYLPATNVFVYDLNGNMTSDGKRAFDYDDEDQLIRITATNAWKSEFTYDGKMRMRIRKEFTWNGAWIQSQEVHYVYDGNLAIQERDQNNTPRVSYTRGTDLSSSFQGAGGIGGLLARTDNSVLYVDPSSAHAYYHADGNGNITALLNSFQGFAAKYNYDPFGNILSQSGHLADANLYRFSSKESHPNSGLVYYLYRFYSSAHQRWLNKDPLGEAGGFNLYGFARNDLISGIDPLGLTGSSVLAAVETGVPSQAEIAAMVAEGNALLAPQAAVGPGVFGAGTTGVLATSVAEVGVGTVLVGGTVAVGVGGAIGLGASQLPVVGGGTVADFWGGVLYDTFWPRPGPVRMPTPVRAKVPFVEVSPEQLAGWVELPIREVRDRCGSGKCSCVASCQNHISGNGIGWVFGFASARDCHTAAQLAAKMAANSAAQGTSVRHCKARCAPL
jgi:RHS repeat-associated protein